MLQKRPTVICSSERPGRKDSQPLLLRQTEGELFRPSEDADEECRGSTADAQQGLVGRVIPLGLERNMSHLGVDVSKDILRCSMNSVVKDYPNVTEGHKGIVDWCGPDGQICMESTNRYHLGLANYAWSKKVRCVVLDPKRAKSYLSFVSGRGKTDKMDAQALARLSEVEGDRLRAYVPVPETVQKARDIMSRRKQVVECKVKLELTKKSLGDPSGQLEKLISELKASEKALALELHHTLKGYPEYELLQTIPGIGVMSAAVLLCALERGEFATSDSLIAFAGLDPVAADSGQKHGKRRLSHRGDAQLRTILYMAAQTGARLEEWRPYYVSQLAKGYSTTEATVIVARKLMRVAWSMYKHKCAFASANAPKTLDKAT